MYFGSQIKTLKNEEKSAQDELKYNCLGDCANKIKTLNKSNGESFKQQQKKCLSLTLSHSGMES